MYTSLQAGVWRGMGIVGADNLDHQWAANGSNGREALKRCVFVCVCVGMCVSA